MDISLVTDILAPDSDISKEPLSELYQANQIDALDSERIEYAEAVIDDLKNTDSKEEVVDVVSRFVATNHYSFSYPLETLFLAMDFDKNPENKDVIIGRIESFVSNMKMRLEKEKMYLITRSADRSFDLLADIFGDDLNDFLVDITGAKIPTIKRWQTTGKMNSRARRKISHSVSVFFQMQDKLEWSNEDILNWLDTPISSTMPSPRDIYRNHQSGYYAPSGLRKNLDSIGIDWRSHY